MASISSSPSMMMVPAFRKRSVRMCFGRSSVLMPRAIRMRRAPDLGSRLPATSPAAMAAISLLRTARSAACAPWSRSRSDRRMRSAFVKRGRRIPASATPRDQYLAVESKGKLALPVRPVAVHLDEAPFGPRGERAFAGDRQIEGENIAGIDGLQPFEITEARRGSERRNGLAAFKALPSRLIVAVNEAAHPARGGVPAAGDERAEGTARSGFVVDMEGLWIVGPCKPQDGLAGEAVLAEI